MLIKYIQTLFTLSVGLASYWITSIYVTGVGDTTRPIFQFKHSLPYDTTTR